MIKLDYVNSPKFFLKFFIFGGIKPERSFDVISLLTHFMSAAINLLRVGVQIISAVKSFFF